MTNYNEGDIVLCTVTKIEHTTVFVNLPTGEEGTIVFSEIAPGRIKNIREYVVPNKKIVCKIIRVSEKAIDLSLRRVSAKERTEVMEKYKQEQTAKSALTQILKEKAKEIIEKITQSMSLSEFLLKAKESEELIKKHIPSEYREIIKKITQKKTKEVEVKKILKLKSHASDGLITIKKILSVHDNKISISYISAGNYFITVKSDNYKNANKKIEELIKKIETDAKKFNCDFEIVEK